MVIARSVLPDNQTSQDLSHSIEIVALGSAEGEFIGQGILERTSNSKII
ncbi:MAG: hypothetical protein KME17_12405 [Cyanosarcina radialis HA8281-LM2]|nr:hypothetical protein [Cyanosarcina radialis HA8281-LM2]